MASCVKCGAVLIAQARFCATCGSPVTRGSAPPPAAPPKSIAPSAPDPFARTMMGDDIAAVLDTARAPELSPMGASSMNAQKSTPPPAAPIYSPPVAYAPRPTPSPPAGPAQYAQPAAPPMHAIAPGTLVLVYWADGQRYPGTVLQVSPSHVFVAFPNGIQQWIDARYVTVGA